MKKQKKLNKRKIRFFRELFCYWAGRFNLSKDIKFRKDKTDICAVQKDENSITLFYCPKDVAELTKTEMIELVLHEIGHLINDMPYRTKQEQLVSEYYAAQFAINVIKEQYPTILDSVLKLLYKVIKAKTNKDNRIYQKAYKKIPEMQEYIKKRKLNGK